MILLRRGPLDILLRSFQNDRDVGVILSEAKNLIIEKIETLRFVQRD